MASRARVKVKGPTRAQQAAEFSRKKQKLRARQWKRRGLMGAGVALVAYLGVGGWWLQHTGKIEKAVTVSSNAFWGMTADMGFRLDQVYLKGRDHADAAAVKAALEVSAGMPIFALPLDDIRTRLEAIPEVKTAFIQRQLPNKLSITLGERLPAAIWQREGQHSLVDAEGIVLASEKYKSKGPLPVIVGDDAPNHVRELVALLDLAPALKPQVAAAVRVGDRRWNVRLANDVTVMLPEQEPEKAWQRFSRLVDREGLLTKAIRSVDMRMEDRVFIMPLEQQKNPITLTTARDT
jgi:cell division protein FtsQ